MDISNNKITAIAILMASAIFALIFSYYYWRGGRPPISRVQDAVIIYVDKETGVNYLIYDNYNQGGMTVRVDENGKPIITKIQK